MAAVSNGRSAMDSPIETQNGVVDRLKLLYPIVNEEETPLPRAWSAKDKYNYIGLSQNNLRVHYKGHGKTHKDAASVRATHPIPPACGLYYFEVKIISKGRDGYMGVGLSAQGVNMNRLPGWDKNSYGYHGDDGHSFCSSGTGQPYGPTFTTGDVIGCGVNLIDNTCFYTKNGHHLGIAFTDLPPNLYPTVGLQTPGEVVDANFGQQPFVFDIEDMMRELRARTRLSILEYPVPESQEWQAILHKMVSTYLVHHGYCATAEAFAQSTGQAFNEEVTSIKNRQRILKLVLAGRMGEAIELTSRLYPGLLEHNQNLLFMLKCRQFVEMVNGSDSEVCPPRCPRGLASYQSTILFNTNNTNTNSQTNTNLNRPNSPTTINQQTSVIQSTKTFNNNSNTTNNSNNTTTNNSNTTSNNNKNNKNGHSSTLIDQQSSPHQQQQQHHQNNTLNGNSTSVTTSDSVSTSSPIAPVTQTNTTSTTPPIVSKSPSTNSLATAGSGGLHEDSDIEMETTSSDDTQNGHSTTPINSSSSNGKVSPVNGGVSGSSGPGIINNSNNAVLQQSPSQSPQPATTNGYQNGNSHKSNSNNIVYDEDEDMDVDLPLSRRQLCGGSKPAVERMLEFGRELYHMSQRLRQEQGKCERNKKMLRDAFSLLAYSNPWASPVGWQLDPMQRETVCASLNSAILESSDLPRRPPLEVTIAHAQELVRLMSGSGLGSCAFASVDDILQH